MLEKFNGLTLKEKFYLIGGLSLFVIVTCFGLPNRQAVAISLVFTQVSAPLILVIFTCLLIGMIAGGVLSFSHQHGKHQELKSRIAEAEAALPKKDKELLQYKEQVQELKQKVKQAASHNGFEN